MRKNSSKRSASHDTRQKHKKVAAVLNGLPPPAPGLPPKTRKLLRLIRSWLEDESGYDEETWPQLKKALEQNRLSLRRPFDG